MPRTIDIVPPQFRRLVGTRPPHEDPLRRARSMAFALVAECMCAPSSPHWRTTTNGLQLTAETESYIYDGDYGCMKSPYVPGTRPLLERYVAEFIDEDMTESQKAMTLLRAAHKDAIIPRFGAVPTFLYGESDEQTLLKGGGHCSCRSRLLTALCQIAGLEARPLMFWVIDDPDGKIETLGGHTVVEIRIDGHWSFVDPLPGLYVPRDDGKLASIRDIRNNPALLTGLDEAIKDELDLHSQSRDGMTFVDYTAHRFFQPHVPTLIDWYETSWPYEGKWNWATPEFREKQEHDHKFLREFLRGLAESGELTDEVYQLENRALRDRFDLHDQLQLSPPRDAFAS